MKYALLIIASVSLSFLLVESCKHSQKTTQEGENVMKDRILVLLKNRVPPQSLEIVFDEYGLTNQGQTSRTENRWIFTFDDSTIKAEELLKKIKKSELVLEAELAPMANLEKG